MSRKLVRAPEGPPVRVDRLLTGAIGGLSRRGVRELVERGLVRVGGRPVRKGALVPGGTEVAVELPEPATLAPEPEPAPPVLYEDEHLLAIDKPAGRAGHALRASDRGTIANFLAARHPETAAASERPLDHGLVHRLDTDTSGVLLVARTRAAWLELRRQFRSREVDKRYVALVRGEVAAPGEVRRPIASDPKSRRRVRVAATRSPGAREALTRYRPLARYDGFTLLEIDLVTGLRHQIRAHLAALGHPVVGDSVYSGPSPGDPPVGRHLLHAAAIAFTHPSSGRRLTVTSPLPADFDESLERLGSP